MIASGQLRKGDKVPSESELMEQYYVSAITAKNALNALADQGLIVRVRGKGSFVNASPYSVPRTETSSPISIGAIFPSLSSPIDQNYIVHLNELCQEKITDSIFAVRWKTAGWKRTFCISLSKMAYRELLSSLS